VLAALGTSPDEGRTDGGAQRFEALERRYSALADPDHYYSYNPAAASWIDFTQADAKHANVSFHIFGGYTQRRYHLVLGLVILAERGADSDDTVRSIVASIIGDVAFFAGVTTGAVLGSLSAADARIFSARCELLTTTTVDGVVGADGHTRL
jgi:hypothetical protein